MTAARQPAFYSALGVPDTPEGRYELIALHLYLALESIRAAAHEEDLDQRLLEVFVADMDDCMREMGVGDMGVPKKVKRAAGTFYERAKTYQRDLAAVDNQSLAGSLRRYVFAGVPAEGDASAALARYVRGVAAALKAEPFDLWVVSGAARRLLEATASEFGMAKT